MFWYVIVNCLFQSHQSSNAATELTAMLWASHHLKHLGWHSKQRRVEGEGGNETHAVRHPCPIPDHPQYCNSLADHAATSPCSYSLFALFKSFHVAEAILCLIDRTIVILSHAFIGMWVIAEMVLHCGSPVNFVANSHYIYNLLVIF